MATRYLERGDGKIAYELIGQGPLVVCVPSMGDLRGEYRFLAPRLVDAGYSVATMDVRGHGESSVKWDDYSVAAIGSDIVALVRALQRGPAVVVGASMAAGAAVVAAAEAPECVSRIILIGPFVHDVGGNAVLNRILPLLFADLWGASMWGMYYSSLYPSVKPDDFDAYTNALKRNLSEAGRLAALRAMLAASKRASAERLDQVRAPVLVLMGSRDPDFKNPAAEAEWVGKQLNGTVKIVENAGHYPHAEMPDIVTPLVLGFLDARKEPSHGAQSRH